MFVATSNAQPLRGKLGLFSSCETDGDNEVFKAKNLVEVYPGKTNHWLIGRTSESVGSIVDFIKKYVVEPLDTSLLIANVPYTISEVKRNASGTWTTSNPEMPLPRLAMFATGLRPQAKSSGSLSPAVKPAGEVTHWYVVSFTPPIDAPAVLPWPVQGCVESAGWYLAGATSDVWITTGQKMGYTSDELAKRAEEGAPDPVKTLKKYAVAAVVVVGGIYLMPALARAYVSFRKASRGGA